jgi:hypothetical protein
MRLTRVSLPRAPSVSRTQSFSLAHKVNSKERICLIARNHPKRFYLLTKRRRWFNNRHLTLNNFKLKIKDLKIGNRGNLKKISLISQNRLPLLWSWLVSLSNLASTSNILAWCSNHLRWLISKLINQLKCKKISCSSLKIRILCNLLCQNLTNTALRCVEVSWWINPLSHPSPSRSTRLSRSSSMMLRGMKVLSLSFSRWLWLSSSNLRFQSKFNGEFS